MANVCYFEIGADDPEGAASFYSKVFAWKIEKSPDGSNYWYITTGDEEDPGIAGGLGRRFDELNPTVNTISVPSLNDCAMKIAEAGGKVLTPKIPIAGVGYVQDCLDLEGNAFRIMEYDESAQ